MKTFAHVRWIALLLAALPLLPRPARAAEKCLAARFGPEGLAALNWAGDDLLGEGRPVVKKVVFESKTLGEDGLYDYAFEAVETAEPKVRFDRSAKRLTYAYPWGSVAFAYAAGGNRLTVTATIANESERTIAMFDMVPFVLALPEPMDKPKHWRGTTRMPGQFNAVEANYGQQKLLLCCETVMPLRFGFDRPQKKNTVLPVRLRGGVNILEPGGVVYHHHGLPRIEPGKKLTIRFSLRPAAVEADNDEILADVQEAFRAYHRPRFVWTDRRPIGAIFLAPGKGPAGNPRNWFKDKDLDVRTEAGRAELRKKMMQHADRCIEVLKKTNAQGMILWDPEGAENPHPITFIGDPRMVKILAPEMEDIYPAYFKKFLDAGLRTGCCIRPTQVYLTPPAAACDGELDSRWSVQDPPHWIEVDFGENKTINKAELVFHADRAYQYLIEARADGGEYATIVDRKASTEGGSPESPVTDAFKPVQARYVKLTVTGAHKYDGRWVSVREFRVLTEGGKNACLNNVADSSRPLGRTAGGHGTGAHNPDRNPLGDDFSAIWPKGVPAWRFYPIVERMSRKIDYAKKHWGCTIIYIDTNGVHRPVGPEQKHKWTLLDNHIWRELHKRHPDVLLIPEFAPNPGQLAYTSCYLQPPYSPPVTRPFWRKLLPGAFSVSYTVNLDKETWQGLRERLVGGVAAGDSLFFRGWFGDHYNKKIKAVYDEVYKPGRRNPGLPASYTERAED